MVTPSQIPKHHLQPLTTHWHNRSLSSLSATSETATFHSALAHHSHSNMELRQLSHNLPQQTQPSILTSLPLSNTPLPSPKLTAIKMDRQDSGYAESPASPISDSRRTSTSSTGRRTPNSGRGPKRKTTISSSTSSTTRPTTKRASRSSGTRTSNPGPRPPLSTRHTTPYTTQSHTQTSQPYQFFQFPSLTDPSPPTSSSSPPADQTTPPPPPATIHYWTSDSTRRLEYAAIDAASKGVRGFFIKLLPDCILPAGSRRTKFHCEDGDSDAGSVRRYRLALPEEKEACSNAKLVQTMKAKKPGGVLRRWTTFGKRGRSMD